MKIIKLAICFVLLTVSPQLIGQDSSLLTIDRIYGSNEFAMRGYGPTQWLDSGLAFTTLELNPERNSYDLVRYEAASMERSVLVEAAELKPTDKDYPINVEAYSWNPTEDRLLIFTNSSRVWRANTKGDYWIFDLKSRELSQVGKEAPASSLMFAKFNPQGDKIAYVCEFNLFVEDLITGKVTQLTKDGDGKIINGTFDWVYEEEFSCRDGFRWSPDGNHIAFWQVDASDTKEFYMINNTDSIYSQIIPVQYPKVGEPPSACKIATVNLSGDLQWIEVPGHPREHYLPRMQWVDSETLLIQQLNRKQNHYKMFLADLHEETVKLSYEEKSETWIDIDHPDLTMGFTVTDLPLVEQGGAVLKTSEKGGWRQIYKVDLSTGEETIITKGEYDVARYYTISGDYILINASPQNSTQRYLYRVALDGSGRMNRLTPKAFRGVNRYNISDHGQFAFHDHSSVDDPRTIRLVSLPDHRIIETVQDNQAYKEKIGQLQWPEIEFFEIEIEEDVVMDGRLYKPINFDATKKYPVMFNVYGEPWGQTATDSWGSLYSILLAQQGYCVINIDNRGTPCLKGTEWRKSIYRKIGQLNASDQAKAAEQILAWDFIDEDRVAVWGWSGGGSMTLNLLFQYPDLYHTGISVAPVSWQLYYDNIYQERYMGLPQENREDFVKGSPLTYAKNLEGNLLLVHGTADDNVHYQNAEALINELVKHNKMFSLMSYPNRSHGIYEGPNTRRHLYTMMNTYLQEHCPPGAKTPKVVRP